MKQTERSNKIYSAEFKINVIIDMQSNYLSYRETVNIIKSKFTTNERYAKWVIYQIA